MGNYELPDGFQQWMDWLTAGLHGRNRWRLPIVMLGVLFGTGRRTVSSWLRAAGVETGYRSFYYFLSAVGRLTWPLAERLAALVLVRVVCGDVVQVAIDDSPTKRYGPHVEGAGIHRNPTPGPSQHTYVYGHVWVTLAIVLEHSLWGVIGLPLLACLYVRQKDIAPLTAAYGVTFETKLLMAVRQTLWLARLVNRAGKMLEVVADGAYAKRAVLRALMARNIAVISRLQKNAALRDLPHRPRRRVRGRPPIYGPNQLSLVKRAAHPSGWDTVECVVYGALVVKSVKTFLATWRPAGGVIRVVIVREAAGVQFFFSTNPQHSVRHIIESFSRRSVIEQIFHDVKEIQGAGQQQVRNYWSNLACWHLSLWMHTLVELWAWDRSHDELVDRSHSPWDDPTRRPSHADRRNALKRQIMENQLTRIMARRAIPAEILNMLTHLMQLAL